mmetsp:Transcript_1503/g.3898  ORF Transcript_1503/g.3898 Transcript_1503/m.3898 type:complete len:130 (+) Transcript_1503:5812-6201(+)
MYVSLSLSLSFKSKGLGSGSILSCPVLSCPVLFYSIFFYSILLYSIRFFLARILSRFVRFELSVDATEKCTPPVPELLTDVAACAAGEPTLLYYRSFVHRQRLVEQFFHSFIHSIIPDQTTTNDCGNQK